MRRLFEQREFAVDGEHDVGFILVPYHLAIVLR